MKAVREYELRKLGEISGTTLEVIQLNSMNYEQCMFLTFNFILFPFKLQKMLRVSANPKGNPRDGVGDREEEKGAKRSDKQVKRLFSFCLKQIKFKLIQFVAFWFNFIPFSSNSDSRALRANLQNRGTAKWNSRRPSPTQVPQPRIRN